MTKLMKTAALAGDLVAFLASTALELRAAEPNVREGQADRRPDRNCPGPGLV